MSPKYAGYWLAQMLSASLPAPLAFWVAERVADAQWRRPTADRLAVQRNLSIILEAPAAPHAELVRNVFRNFGRYLVEFFAIHRMAQPGLTIEGAEHLREAQERHRGTILLTGHLGNWEAGAALIQRMGYPVTVVALPHDDPRLDRLFNRQRQRCGLDVIPLGEDVAHRSLRSLRDGRLLGILGDREFTGQGLRARLFRRPVVLPRGPAVLSLRSRAPAVPTFLIREGRWQFRLCFEPPIWPGNRGAGKETAETLTQRYAEVLERYLKRFPDQWLMFRSMFEG